jgi:hypothetical protein
MAEISTGDIGAGFRLEFKNGFMLSVQFGPGLYADNYRAPMNFERVAKAYSSKTAELAVMNSEGEFVTLDGSVAEVAEQVMPYVPVEEIPGIIAKVEAIAKEEE